MKALVWACYAFFTAYGRIIYRGIHHGYGFDCRAGRCGSIGQSVVNVASDFRVQGHIVGSLSAPISSAWDGVRSVQWQNTSEAASSALASVTGALCDGLAVALGTAAQAFASDPEVPLVLVVAQDTKPDPRINEHFPHILEYALSHLDHWDVIDLSVESLLPPANSTIKQTIQYRSPHLLRVGVWSGGHAVLVNRAVLSRLQTRRTEQHAKATVNSSAAAIQPPTGPCYDSGLTVLVTHPVLVRHEHQLGTAEALDDTLRRDTDGQLHTLLTVLFTTPHVPAVTTSPDLTSGDPYYGWGPNTGRQVTLAPARGAETDSKVTSMTAHVINMARRPDRWAAVSSAWASVRSISLQRFDAVPHIPAPEGHTINGCTASHIKAVEEAFTADPGLQMVMIMEDDAVPRPNFDEIFPHVLEYALSHLGDWHIINLGTSQALPSGIPEHMDDRTALIEWYSPHLLRASVWSAAHAILVNRRALPAYRRLADKYTAFNASDAQSYNDWQLAHDRDVITLVTVPTLAGQALSYSDMLGLWADYSVMEKEAERVLRFVMDGLSAVGPGAVYRMTVEGGLVKLYPHEGWHAYQDAVQAVAAGPKRTAVPDTDTGRLAAKPYAGWANPPPRTMAVQDPRIVATVVNMASRPERWTQVQQDWAHVQWVRLNRTDAIRHYRLGNTTVNGCTASHIKAVEEAFAADPDLQVALVLEDDAVPRPNFDEIFPQVLEYALTALDHWSIINLGPSQLLPTPELLQHHTQTPIFQWRTPHLLRVNVWSAGQALLINRKALPAYAAVKDSFVRYDISVAESMADFILSRWPGLTTLVSVPGITMQRPGHSDLEHRAVDYTSAFDTANELTWYVMAGLIQRPEWPAVETLANLTRGVAYEGWGPNPSVDMMKAHLMLVPATGDLSERSLQDGETVNIGPDGHQHTAFVISLASRPDRWQALQAAWAGVTSVQLSVFPAVQHFGWINRSHIINGCTSSHIRLVEEAFEADPTRQWLLVLEDDAVPRHNFDEIFPHLLEYALSHLEDWHIINLGTSRVWPLAKLSGNDDRLPIFQWRSPHLLRASVWSAAHAILVNRRALPAYREMRLNCTHYERTQPLSINDWYLSHRSDVVTLVSVPVLATQAAGHSDIEDRYVNYRYLFNRTDTVLREVEEMLAGLPNVSALVFDPELNRGQPYDAWGPSPAR